jgi:N-acetylglutamate synthase-like GNAT family acetyltransferase
MVASQMIIRPARATDQTTIRRIVWRAGINPMGLHWPRFLVAEQDGQIIGVAQVKPHRDGSRELASLAVIPAHRGRGVGRALIHTLQADQAPPLYLMCEARLGGYYPRFGFQPIDPPTMPPYFRRIHRLMNLLTAPDRPRLLVMRWDGYAPGESSG